MMFCATTFHNQSDSTCTTEYSAQGSTREEARNRLIQELCNLPFNKFEIYDYSKQEVRICYLLKACDIINNEGVFYNEESMTASLIGERMEELYENIKIKKLE